MTGGKWTFEQVFSQYEETYPNKNIFFKGTLRNEFENISNKRIKKFIVGYAPIEPIKFERDGRDVKCVFRYKVMDSKEYVNISDYKWNHLSKIDDSIINRVKLFHKQGLTFKAIGKELKINPVTASNIINRKGRYANEA